MSLCARVLAAALTTGAIAAAVSLPTLSHQGGEGHRAVIAPPSSHQQTLRLPALSVPAHHIAVVRKGIATGPRPSALASVRFTPRPETIVNPGLTGRPRPAPAPAPVAPTPAPAPAPAPPPAPAPAPAPATPPQPEPAPVLELASQEPAAPTAPAPAPVTATDPATEPDSSDGSCSQSDQDDDHGQGHDDHGHGRDGHDGNDKQSGDDSSQAGAEHGNGNGDDNGHDNEHDN